MRIRLEATSVRIGTEAVERTGIEKFTSTHRHFAFLLCLLGAWAIGQPCLCHCNGINLVIQINPTMADNTVLPTFTPDK